MIDSLIKTWEAERELLKVGALILGLPFIFWQMALF